MNETQTDNDDTQPWRRSVGAGRPSTPRVLAAALLAGSLMLIPAGCERDTEDHLEDAGERLDDAADSVDRATDEALDDVEDTFDDPGSP